MAQLMKAIRITVALAAAGVLSATVRAQQAAPGEPSDKPIVADYAAFAVGPLPDSLPYDRTFYKKYVDANGIPIIGSEKVKDAALLMARDIVIYMLAGRPDLRKEMAAPGYRAPHTCGHLLREEHPTTAAALVS